MGFCAMTLSDIKDPRVRKALAGNEEQMTDERNREKEIRVIESKLAQMRAAKPAHGRGGMYERDLFELEEMLAEKRQELGRPGHEE